MPRASASKPSRLNIRVSEHEKDVLMRAASALNTSVSSFEDFDCGSEPLNDYLRRFAWTNLVAGRTALDAAVEGCAEDVDELSDSSRGGNER